MAEDKKLPETKQENKKDERVVKGRESREEKKALEIDSWKPHTELGKLVKDGSIVDIDEILNSGLKINEPEIVDVLLPDFETDFTARFSFFKNKLLVDGSLFFISGLNYPDLSTGQPQKLPVIIDVSGNASYALTKNVRFFARWNNITATKYKRWYQYPSYRINLVGGLKVQF